MRDLPEGWKESSFGEIAEVIMGQSPKGDECNTIGLGIPLLNGPTEFGAKSPTPVQFTTSARKVSEVNDVLFCVRGSTTGRMNWADQQYALGRGLAAIRHKKGNEYQTYVKGVMDYCLKNLLASATGSTFPNVSRTQLEELEILVPPLPEQKAIADMLSSFDEKIELLREQNKILETLAQTIFKECFVHFNYPDATGEMVDSELGEIPTGWRVGKLGEEFTIVMGQSPKGSSYNESGDGMVFYQGRAEFQSRFPKRRLYTTEPKRIAKKYDVLMSVRAPVGDINVASEKCCIGRGLAAIHCERQSYALYKMLSLSSHFDLFESEGTVFGSINKKSLESIEVIIPPEKLIGAFDELAREIDKKVFNNAEQIQTLSKSRDTLLPKLMSGKVRVNFSQSRK